MIKEKFATAKKFAQDHKPNKDVVVGLSIIASATVSGFVLYKYGKLVIELFETNTDYTRLFEAVSNGHTFEVDGDFLWDTTVNPTKTL